MPLLGAYGTRRRGEANDSDLAAARHGLPAPRAIEQGRVAGALYDFGAYPELLPDRKAEAVVGGVFVISRRLVTVVDAIEEVAEVAPPGDGPAALFRRLSMPVWCADRWLKSIAYPIHAGTVGASPRISGGDWVRLSTWPLRLPDLPQTRLGANFTM